MVVVCPARLTLYFRLRHKELKMNRTTSFRVYPLVLALCSSLLLGACGDTTPTPGSVNPAVTTTSGTTSSAATTQAVTTQIAVTIAPGGTASTTAVAANTSTAESNASNFS